MSAVIGIALGAMSTRRRLLLRSLIERVGPRLQPAWVIRDTPEAADVLLYDAAALPAALPERVLALPLLAADEVAPEEGLCLHFPPAPAELARFLDSAAQVLGRSAVPDTAAPLRTLADAVLALAQGRHEVVGFGADDQRVTLTAADGYLRLHIEDDTTKQVPMTVAELSQLRLLPTEPAIAPGSMRAANDFVWALARALRHSSTGWWTRPRRSACAAGRAHRKRC